MDGYAQDKRLLQVKTVLDDNPPLLTELNGREQISFLYAYELDLVSTDFAIGPERMLGTPITVSVNNTAGVTWSCSGIVSHFGVTGAHDGRNLCLYHARLVPTFWLLTRTSDCRIFQNQNVKDIVSTVLAQYGVDRVSWKLINTYGKREYCVQYRETAYDFICRLLEEEGIFFYFTHGDDGETIIFSDYNRGLYECSLPTVPIVPNADALDGVWKWDKKYRFRTGLHSLSDYNFKTPSSDLGANSKTVNSVLGKRPMEKFDYPGRYSAKSDGQALSKLRMEYEESAYYDIIGQGACVGFGTGGCFTLENLDQTQDSTEYFLVEIAHTAKDWAGIAGESNSPSYVNEFRCRPRSIPFRPEIKTPCPRIHSVQTAVVTGPGGSEICTDSFGRIKVHFYWDRHGKHDDSSSCWIRVAQGWAGKGWGEWYVPRIGQEVVVMFMEGDPDRPLVVGSVYNAEQVVPFALPGNATQSGVRTRSSAGGGAGNCNEFRFEDKMGAEQVYLHAERNLDSSVELDETRLVGHNQTTTIQHDQMLTVQHDRTKSVTNNETTTVGGNRTETVVKNETVNINMSRTHTIGMNDQLTVALARVHTVGASEAISVGAARTVTVGLAQTVTIGATLSSSVGSNKTTSVGGSETTSVRSDRSATVGGNESLNVSKGISVEATESISIQAGKQISITATDEIVLTSGSASITLKKNGDISIEGKQISINGSGNVIIKGQKILQN